MEAGHIIPWNKGGKTTLDNCQMLCRMDNRTKSGK
ncbi:HNH endonuclease signature motif containing protein [Limnohabitans sp.]